MTLSSHRVDSIQVGFFFALEESSSSPEYSYLIWSRWCRPNMGLAILPQLVRSANQVGQDQNWQAQAQAQPKLLVGKVIQPEPIIIFYNISFYKFYFDSYLSILALVETQINQSIYYYISYQKLFSSILTVIFHF